MAMPSNKQVMISDGFNILKTAKENLKLNKLPEAIKQSDILLSLKHRS